MTTDPLRDTPEVIRAWLDHFDPAFVGLTGSISAIEEAERQVGMPLASADHMTEPGASYQVVHAGYILVYTPDNLAHLEFPVQILPSQEAHDLEVLLEHGWRG